MIQQECVVCVNESRVDPYQSPHLATHAICRQCLQTYVHGKVVKEQNTKIICPGTDCKVELTYEEIRANSESDTFVMSDSSQQGADLDMTNFLFEEPARQILISNSVQTINVAKVNSFPMLVSCPPLVLI